MRILLRFSVRFLLFIRDQGKAKQHMHQSVCDFLARQRHFIYPVGEVISQVPPNRCTQKCVEVELDALAEVSVNRFDQTGLDQPMKANELVSSVFLVRYDVLLFVQLKQVSDGIFYKRNHQGARNEEIALPKSGEYFFEIGSVFTFKQGTFGQDSVEVFRRVAFLELLEAPEQKWSLEVYDLRQVMHEMLIGIILNRPGFRQCVAILGNDFARNEILEDVF